MDPESGGSNFLFVRKYANYYSLAVYYSLYWRVCRQIRSGDKLYLVRYK